VLLAAAPDGGWFSYVPLAGPGYDPGKRADVWAQLVTFTELSSLACAVSLIVTILKHRAPGMSLDRMPLFVWAMLVQSVMIVFAMPAVMLGSSMLAADRLLNTRFFDLSAGGDALLWQHMFWFFGHPEVYIIFVPALGILSSLLTTFTRRQIFGYPALVVSLVATGFLGFGVWVHHMFATGIPQLGSSFFTASSIVIVLPTGVQFFCWIATLWGSTIVRTTAMLFALGFFAVFLIGGMTGVMLASVPINVQVHDTFFVVAHLHYVLIGGSVFPVLGGVYYWYPKWTGRLLSERLGRWNFWLFFVGFNTTFFPLHILGLMGMPRRIYTYSSERGWDALNMLASLGSGVLALAVLLLIVNLLVSRRRGVIAGANPWQADTLEWATSSPPPSYSFAELPTVNSRHPLWTKAQRQPVVYGVRPDRRELLVTLAVDAEPDHRTELPGPTLWPLVAAIATGATFIGAIYTAWALVWGAAALALSLIGWYWPSRPHAEDLADEQPGGTRGGVRSKTAAEGALEPAPISDAPLLNAGSLPIAAFGSRDPLWWGVCCLMAIEGTVFALLFVAYFYLRDRATPWPPTPLARSSLQLAAAGLGVLLLSCWPMRHAAVAAERGQLRGMRRGLLLASVLGLAFLVLRFYEFGSLPFRWDSHAHGSVFWLLLCSHTLHGVFGCGENLMFLALLWRGPVEEKHLVDVSVNGMYWYFIVIADALCVAILDVDPWLFSR
jgi:cytochrome c oxidase subunit 1/cytochrome c oxidase subunit I+III